MAVSGRVLSVNVARASAVSIHGRRVMTAIGKHPVDECRRHSQIGARFQRRGEIGKRVRSVLDKLGTFGMSGERLAAVTARATVERDATRRELDAVSPAFTEGTTRFGSFDRERAAREIRKFVQDDARRR